MKRCKRCDGEIYMRRLHRCLPLWNVYGEVNGHDELAEIFGSSVEEVAAKFVEYMDSESDEHPTECVKVFVIFPDNESTAEVQVTSECVVEYQARRLD